MSFEPTTPPQPETKPKSKPALFHGIEELPPDERAFYERQLYFRPETNQVNRYVRVDGSDYLGRGYQECIAREIEHNPHLAGVLQRLERNAERHAHGLKIQSRHQ